MLRLGGVLLMVLTIYAILMWFFPNARPIENHRVLAGRLGFYGILTLGVGVLIISGGIDLSIGSLVGLSAVCYVLVLNYANPWIATLIILAGGAVVGIVHGLLITKLRLQPFLVTLCGLFIYRGLARGASKASVDLPEYAEELRKFLVSGHTFGIPHQLIVLLVIAGLLAVLVHGSVYGRYLYAIGYNEQAAAYAGIATDRYKILAYTICSTLAALGGVLFILDNRTATPSSAGSLLELYAITGAVLGGCSLRGGEGSVCGMLLGAAVLPLVYQICNFSKYIGSDLENTVIGAALLLGTIGNELVARRAKK